VKLFILSRAVLDRLPAGVAPQAGDAVAYFREGQDARGVARGAWAAAGIEIVAAEDLVTIEEVSRLEGHFQTALFRWCESGGRDVTSDGEVSIAAMMSPRIKVEYNFFYLARAGAILKRLIDRAPPGAEIVTDLVDGCYTYSDNRGSPQTLQWRRLLGDLARQRDITVRDLSDPEALPSFIKTSHAYRLGSIVGPLFAGWHPRRLASHLCSIGRSLLAGPQLRGLFAKLRAPRLPDGRPGLYLFLQPTLTALAINLGVGGKLRVVNNALTADHLRKIDPNALWAAPGLRLLAAAWRTWRLIRDFERHGLDDPALRWDGVDFAPYLVAILAHMRREKLISFLIMIAQTRRLVRLVRPQAVVVSGDYLPSTLALAGLRKRAGFQMYFVNHGFDLAPCCLYASRMADREMTYVAEAEAIVPVYGFWLPEAEKPRRVAVTTPVMLPILGVRGTRRDVRRVLFTGYSSYTPHTVTHTAYYDRYLVHMLSVARELRRDGIAVRYRPHPGEVRDDVHRLLKLLGDDGTLEFCDRADFATALSDCDVYDCNATTCYYQALFAGWPSIFFEPGDARRLFVGLPADADSGRPLARDADELLALIRQAYDPASAVARFPETFNRQLAGRYLGREPARADQVLQRFFESELLAA
jgi:hypothetical protein